MKSGQCHTTAHSPNTEKGGNFKHLQDTIMEELTQAILGLLLKEVIGIFPICWAIYIVPKSTRNVFHRRPKERETNGHPAFPKSHLRRLEKSKSSPLSKLNKSPFSQIDQNLIRVAICLNSEVFTYRRLKNSRFLFRRSCC